jgi:hypothetical protein
MTWQPMDTAPEHGPILVRVGHIAFINTGRRVDIARRDLSRTLWLSHEGYDLQPTAWVALPDVEAP